LDFNHPIVDRVSEEEQSVLENFAFPSRCDASHIPRAMIATSHSKQVNLHNAAGKFIAGSYCNVHLEILADANLTKLPLTAPVTGNQGMQVATLDGNNAVVLMNVQLGRDLGVAIFRTLCAIGPSAKYPHSSMRSA
jgi:hypothetical protein